MADDPDDIARIKEEGRKKRVKELRDAAAWWDHTTPAGFTKQQAADKAAQYRAEAAAMTIDPNFGNFQMEHERMLHIAANVTAASEKQSEDGKRSGDARRAKAEEAYRNKALELAKSIRGANPGLSQVDLAHEIVERWKSETPLAASMLIQLISKWEGTACFQSEPPRRHTKNK